MVKFYFIDYENVHVDGFAGCEQLNEKDVVCVMYTEQSKNITLDIIERLTQQNAVLESYKVITGTKNSLDFQLSTYLGYTIAKNEAADAEYYIVSKDTGFDTMADFWVKRGVNVKRIVNLAGAAAAAENKTEEEDKTKEEGKTKERKPKEARTKEIKKEAKKAPPKKKMSVVKAATKEEMMKYLLPEEYEDGILEVFNSYKTKQAIYNGLSKAFKDSKKTGTIYKKLKSLMKEKDKT